MAADNPTLVEPFDVDDKLDDIQPEQAFTLGVEWAMFRFAIAARRPFTRTIHRANAERLATMCARHERQFTLRHLDDHWSEIDVPAVPIVASLLEH